MDEVSAADWLGTLPGSNEDSHLPSLQKAEVSELKELVDSLGDSPEKRRQAFGDPNRWNKLPELMESAAQRDGLLPQGTPADNQPGASLRWKTTINLTKAIRKGGTLRNMVAMSNAGKVAEKAKEAEKRSMDVTMDMQESERSNSGMPRSKTGPAGQKKANPKSGQNGLQSVVMKLMGPKSDMNSTQSSFGAASSLGDFVPSTPGTAGSTEEDGLAAKPQFPSPSARKMANILQRVRARQVDSHASSPPRPAELVAQVPQTAPDLGQSSRRRSLLDVGRPAGSRWNQTWTATQEGSLSQTSRTDSRSQDERPGQWRMGDVSLPTTPRAALPALKESSKWMKVNKRVRDAILGHSGQSESLARDSKAAARRASQLPSLAGEDSQELGLEVRRPSLLRRDSFTAASAPQPASPRGVLAAAPAEPTPPPSVAQLASALIDHFGSLTRAYDHFDFSRKGRFSRAQFYAGCASVRLNFRTLSGLTVREIFKRMDDANLEDNPEAHRVAPRGEICRMKWMNFFETELQGSETAELLTADKGSEVERRLEERRKERGLQKVGEDSAPTSPSGQSGQTAPTVQTVAEVARARDVFMKRLKGIAESESREVNRSAEGSDSKGRGHLHPDRRMSSSKPRRISGTSGKGSSDDEDGAMARQTSGASSQPVQPMTTGRRGSSHGVGGRRRSSAEPVRRRSKQLRVETAPNLSNTQEDASASSSDDGLSDVEEEGKVPAKSAQELEAEFEGKDDEEVGEEDGLGALLQRSDDAVEERLRRVLQKGVGTKDFEVMDEAELQAVAEQEEIANVIQTIGASGKLALAWVFIKKLGSLKRAFKWFDTRNTRKIPQVVWDTGFTLLHIDAERLTGWRPFDIFKQIDTEPSDGTISYKEWNNFFADAAKTIALEMESLGGIDFEQQVKLRRHNLKLMRDKRRKAGNRAEDSWLDDLQEKQAMKQQEEEFTKRVRAKITALDEGQSFLFGRDWLCTAEEALLLLKPLKRSDIVQQVAESLGIWSLPSPALIDVREMLKFRPGLGGSQDPRMVQYSLQPVMEMPQDGLKVDKGGDSGSILVVNLTEFTKSTEDRLKEIPIHASEEFPTSLSELERGVVKTLAQRMGFACSVEKKGALFQITVFNVTGHFVKDMERQLRELEEGQGMRLSKELSDEERRLVKAMAEQMGYAVTQTSAGIEVTNLSTYAKQIREDLSQLGVGETQRIQLSSATDEQQVILQRVAAELGLDWEEEGTRRQRIATVGNMVSLVEEMREKLSDNTSSGTVLSFILPPTESQRETFFNMAQNYGFECIGKEDTEQGVRAYLRRLSFERSSLAARRRRNSISATASTPKGDGQFGLGETEPHGQQESHALLEEDQEESGLEEDSEEEVKPELEEDESVEEDSAEPSELKEDDMSDLLLMRGLQSGEDHLIPRVFRRYASGNWRGKVLFLRYGDVKDFAEDLKYVTPNVDTRLYRFTGMFEYLFEDTLQLQIDMGVRVGQGLTIEWFQIFLQKIIARLGKQFVPVLFQLLDE